MRNGFLSRPLPLTSSLDSPVIQYADDTLLILPANEGQLLLLKNLLIDVGNATGLKTSPPSHRGKQNGTNRIKENQPRTRDSRSADTLEGPASTAACEHRPDASTGANQAHLARPNQRGFVKLPSALCSTRATSTAAPSPRRFLSPPEAAGAEPGPPGPRWAPKGPDLGQAGASPSHPAAPQPSGCCCRRPRHPTSRRPGMRRRATQGRPSPPEPKPTLSAPPPTEETPCLPSTRAGKAAPPPPAPHGALPDGSAPTAAAVEAGGGGRGGARVLGALLPPAGSGSKGRGRGGGGGGGRAGGEDGLAAEARRGGAEP
nr:formin-like protein 5 [Lolium perenne]